MSDPLLHELARRLWPRPPEGHYSDAALNPGTTLPQATTPAAVLVAVVDRPEAATILLTRRTAHLNDHAGQVSFPGGRVEPDDADAIATALRETEEELGLGRERIEPLGFLPRYRTLTGFEITPVVARVAPGFELAPDPFEVAEVFELELIIAVDPENYRSRHYDYHGRRRDFYVLPHPRHHIWGATAGMLKSLADRMAEPHGGGRR